ncbi:sigma-70 family RNA polymerase sigma factor [Synechococcus sp. 8F6]|uniref:sigma-70 family RNA polymerase sigma factor n=1 Tax=Synechococcus sp. 8F6 TaxID=2025606 RepID=UPI0013030A36|nr:sigma-70 family RNA polymerase sigma factor [Synechococcus sp. 8F6]
MAASPDATTRLLWRNALVEHNLALVRMVAQRHTRRSGQPFDDLVSAGGFGLIRAVEAFDLRQRCNFSSFAVPYIEGAMRHDVRDHGQPLHTPRRLRELQQRARRLQEQRRGQGLAPLQTAQLAEELGCTPTQLQEAAAVQRALQVRSLDAPLSGSDGEEAGCLLDQLAAGSTTHDADSTAGCATGCSTGWATAGATPHTEPDTESDTDADSEQQLQCRWLHSQLTRLNQLEQRLLEGRWMEGLSWSELALELRLTSRQARVRGDALLAWLQEAAASTSGASSSGASAMASRAAIAV